MLLHSFTEPHRRIDFDEPTHVYTDMDTGKRLISATTYIKKYKEPFDTSAIAKRCEEQYNWGVEAKDIQKLWGNSGQIASSFGTALHEALELYTNYKKLGGVIQGNTNRKDNPALPKHPVLRKIILEFEAIDKYYSDYTVITEAFISCGPYCGLIDRLYVNMEKKTGRLGDYKFNVDAHKTGKQNYLGRFAHLPTNKVSGYRLQMSFYAAILAYFRWEILGLDAFVYDDHWEHLELDVLDDVIEL